MECTVPQIVGPFFGRALGLNPSADFRGVLWLPDDVLSDAEQANGEVQDSWVAVGVGYNAFIGRTCCMHTVIRRPELVSRRMIRAAFEFPFITCHCEAVLALVDSKNGAAFMFDKRLGFDPCIRIPNGALEGDLWIMTMERKHCRWLRPH